MNQELIAKSEAYRMFRYEEMRSTGTYTDINSLVNQSVVDYEAGYTQAITDLSTENAQLREALREMIDTSNNMMNADHLLRRAQLTLDFKKSIEKAKQLLTDKE